MNEASNFWLLATQALFLVAIGVIGLMLFRFFGRARRRNCGEFFPGDRLELDVGTMLFGMKHPEVGDNINRLPLEVVECRYNYQGGHFEVRLRNGETREVIHPEGEREYWYPAYHFVLRDER